MTGARPDRLSPGIDAFERVLAARTRGDVIGGTRECFVGSVEAFAATFGLSSEAGTYLPVSAAEATAVLASVLHRDMAYACEILPQPLAAKLARDFVAQFPPESTGFYTNGTYGLPRRAPGVGPSWQSATDATFDTGIIAMGGALSACVWFTDED